MIFDLSVAPRAGHARGREDHSPPGQPAQGAPAPLLGLAFLERRGTPQARRSFDRPHLEEGAEALCLLRLL